MLSLRFAFMMLCDVCRRFHAGTLLCVLNEGEERWRNFPIHFRFIGEDFDRLEIHFGDLTDDEHAAATSELNALADAERRGDVAFMFTHAVDDCAIELLQLGVCEVCGADRFDDVVELFVHDVVCVVLSFVCVAGFSPIS